ICDTHSEIVGGDFEHLSCSKVPVPGCINNGSERALLIVLMEKWTLWRYCSQACDNAWCSGIGFKTSMTATAAQASIKLESHVSPLSSTITRTTVERTISNDTGTNTSCHKQNRYLLWLILRENRGIRNGTQLVYGQIKEFYAGEHVTDLHADNV